MAKGKKKASKKTKTPARKTTTAKSKGVSLARTKTKTATRTTSATPSLPVEKLAKNVSKARSKSDILAILSGSSGLSKKDVSQLVNNLSELITLDVSKKGPGIFNLPGLMKIVRIHKPATKARKGVNPFTKEPMTFKAKPARNVVKVRVLKGLKNCVN